MGTRTVTVLDISQTPIDANKSRLESSQNGSNAVSPTLLKSDSKPLRSMSGTIALAFTFSPHRMTALPTCDGSRAQCRDGSYVIVSRNRVRAAGGVWRILTQPGNLVQRSAPGARPEIESCTNSDRPLGMGPLSRGSSWGDMR